jgi:tripartite-type tricarboxylate transporter receptor subunit TctC
MSKAALGIVLAAGFALVPGQGTAQTGRQFPSKPIRIVTAPAGSQADIVARMIGNKLSESTGQPVVIENRGGAAGAFAGAQVAKALPDGHTLLLQSPQFAIGAALRAASLPYDTLKDFAGVTRLGFSTAVLTAAPTLGAKSVKELIALVQSKPGQFFYSSAGAGTNMHMNAERFRFAAGIKATHVGFKSPPEALVEVVAGRVHWSLPGLGTALPLIKDGKISALAVLTPQRSPLLPEVPTMVEIIPGYERDGSYSLSAPAGTPRPILNQLSREVGRVLALPDVTERLQAMGFAPAPTTPEEQDRILRADIATFAKVAKLAGLRL